MFEKVENIGQQNLPNGIKEIKEEFKEHKENVTEELKDHKENVTEQLRNLKGIWIGLIIVGVIVLLSNMRGILKICHWCCTRCAKPTTEQVSEEDGKKPYLEVDQDERSQLMNNNNLTNQA